LLQRGLSSQQYVVVVLLPKKVPRLTVTVPGLHKSDGDMQSLFTVFFP